MPRSELPRRPRLSVAAVALLLAAGFSLALPLTSAAICKTNNPVSMLDCLQWAYADRDSSGYAELLSDDFTQYNWGADSTAMDRVAALHAAGWLFKSTAALKLEYLDTGKLKPGATPDTWLLDSVDVKISLNTIFHKDAPPNIIISRFNSFYLHLLPGPPAHMVISKWLRGLQPAPPPSAIPAADR